jgi:hypothetical protein
MLGLPGGPAGPVGPAGNTVSPKSSTTCDTKESYLNLFVDLLSTTKKLVEAVALVNVVKLVTFGIF